MPRSRTQFATRYDFRAPGADAATRQEIFARAVEQAAYVDAHGMDALTVSEHHASDDGYLPSPLLVASAFAAVTSRVPITVSALLVNLYEPVRLAEDIAVLDHLSKGRVAFTFGLGYRPVEYDLYGRSWADRGREVEERIRAVLDAWSSGATTPTPYSRPHPFLFYGGGSPAAARRAGRLGLNFQPQHGSDELKAIYEQACRDAGREPGIVLQAPDGGPANVFCAERPEEFWERYGHHLLADAVAYQEWHGEAGSYVVDHSRTVEEMRSAGVYVVLTADELIERCRAGEIRLVTSHPACGGLPAEPSWESLRLVCETVLPAVRAPDPSASRTGTLPAPPADRSETLTKTIVCGVDNSPTAAAAARKAAELAAALGAELHLVSAYGKIESQTVEIGAERVFISNEMEADRVSGAIAVELRREFPGLEVVPASSDGKPGDALVHAAERLHADVIVVGNKRVQGIARVLGSIARDVVAHAPCDVYVAHTHDH